MVLAVLKDQVGHTVDEEGLARPQAGMLRYTINHGGSLPRTLPHQKGVRRGSLTFWPLLSAANALTLFASAHAAEIALNVDATDVIHGIQHADLIIPVTPGPITLGYPKWIPGEHGPNGPITQLMNIHFVTGSRELPWRRDALDSFAFHLTIPKGASTLHVHLDYFSPPQAFGTGFGKSPDVTSQLLILLFNQVILYPVDLHAEIQVKTRVRLPEGWDFDSALPARRISNGEISFASAPLSTLIDSPLLAGLHLRRLPVTDGPSAIRMTIAAEDTAELAMDDRVVQHLQALVAETAQVFGPGHYRQYAWLLSLGDRLQHDGTEHSESADVRQGESLFTDPDQSIQWRLFPHEYVHSWNGKYRRPAGLATRNFQAPMHDELLWMYEGLTRYYGDLVLSARSHFATPEESRDYLAYVAAQMSNDRPGRSWRSLADTASAVPAYAEAPLAWTTIRRGTDYYNEMLLIWLEADMLIRERTSNRSSLDDFCRSFFAGPERSPALRPYTRGDIVAALRAVAPLDWDKFFIERIDDINPSAPLAGLRASGWNLTFDDTPNPFLAKVERLSSSYNLSFSLGLWISADGTILDVVPASPAYDAGVAPGMHLALIGGTKWSIEAAQLEISAAQRTASPIELVVGLGNESHTVHVNYHGGLRYPHLTGDASHGDRLSDILAPISASSESGGLTIHLDMPMRGAQ
jgi:predicted metalloprotease with PDZ domain